MFKNQKLSIDDINLLDFFCLSRFTGSHNAVMCTSFSSWFRLFSLKVHLLCFWLYQRRRNFTARIVQLCDKAASGKNPSPWNPLLRLSRKFKPMKIFWSCIDFVLFDSSPRKRRAGFRRYKAELLVDKNVSAITRKNSDSLRNHLQNTFKLKIVCHITGEEKI